MKELFDLRGHIYATSHGVTKRSFGGLTIIYALCQATDNKKHVCIGSGQGLIPKIMSLAMRDMGDFESKVTLIDADCEAFPGNGKPEYMERGLLGVDIIKDFACNTYDLFQDRSIDLLWIDHSHLLKDTVADSIGFIEKIKDNGFIGWHDTHNSNLFCEVDQALELLRNRFDIIDMPWIGEGMAIGKPKRF